MLKIRIKPILLLLACCLSGQYAWGDKPAGGEGNTPAQSVLPPWQEGCLDIHLINTGKGESTFYILPDGTTMLIDAASSLLRPEEVLGNGRRPQLVLARQIAMYVCRRRLGLSYPELGRMFGGRDHSTVVHAVKKIKQMLESNKEVQNVVAALEKSAP